MKVKNSLYLDIGLRKCGHHTLWLPTFSYTSKMTITTASHLDSLMSDSVTGVAPRLGTGSESAFADSVLDTACTWGLISKVVQTPRN